MTRILIVRMSALGDIVHALPVLGALREAWPAAEIDWLVDDRYAGILDLVEGVHERILGRPHLARAVARMRARSYDVAIDLQGLLKSALMARLSGARRVIGFERRALRERGAAIFYGEDVRVPPLAHVIDKNLAVLTALGLTVPAGGPRFPLRVPASAVADRMMAEVDARGARGLALINPGAAWPNKRWAPDRFGAVARHLQGQHGLASVVLWGGGEAPLADRVVEAAQGAAVRAPETTLGDLLALAAQARVMISGDTGPLHLAAAVGTPIVGLYGPTWPERNGPWRRADVVVSRAAQCACHHKRQCERDGVSGDVAARMCLSDIEVDEVTAAVDERLARIGAAS